jgi:PAS domain S-box-containing protein
MASRENHLFQSIVEALPMVVLTINNEGYITYANSAITEMTGYSRENIIGKHFTKLDFLIESEIPRITTLFSEIFKGNSPHSIELVYKTKKGELRWGLGHITLLKQGEEVKGAQIVSEEITERKILEQRLVQSEEKHRILMEATREGWVEIEIDGTINSINPMGAKILGYAPEEVIGTNITAYYAHPEEREKLVTKLLNDGFAVDYRIEFKKKNNEIGYVSINGTRYKDATGKSRFITSFRDITNRTTYLYRLETLLDHAAALSIATTIDEVADITEEAITHTIGFNRGSMGIIEGPILNHKYRWGVDREGIFELPLDGPGITVRALKTGETILVPDVTADVDYFDAIGDSRSRSELVVPIIINGVPVAVLNIEHETVNAFTETDRRLVEILAEQISSTLQRLQAQKAQSELLERYSAFSEAASESFVAFDKNFNIIDINEIGAERFGFKREEMLGKSLFDFQHELKGSERYREYLTVMETGIPKVFDIYKHVSGIEFLRINAFKVGEGLGIIASDLSVLHREQQARAKLNQELFEQRVLAEQLAELDRIKTNLMNTATHEIRTPITSIKGYTELMEGMVTDKDSELASYLATVSRNVTRLEHLSNDLLDMQRIESAHMNIEKKKVNITQLMNSIYQEMIPLLREKDQKLEINIETDEKTLQCDELRIIQVFINLITNASNYSPEHTKIDVTITANEKEFKFCVKDQGIGITEDEMPKLFKPFPDIQTNSHQGTGLGLSICKGIVNLHGGDIWVESEGRDMGSDFYFTIPK